MAGLFLLFAQLALHDGLCGDAGVIGARQPENLVAGLAGPAGENVLKGIVEDVAEGQDSGDIRRRDDDRVPWSGGRGVGGEATRFAPAGVPFGFDVTGGVGFGEFG